MRRMMITKTAADGKNRKRNVVRIDTIHPNHQTGEFHSALFAFVYVRFVPSIQHYILSIDFM